MPCAPACKHDQRVYIERCDMHGNRLYHGDFVRQQTIAGTWIISQIDVHDWCTNLGSTGMEKIGEPFIEKKGGD